MYELRYVLIGSVAAHLYGVEVQPGDLDIAPALDVEAAFVVSNTTPLINLAGVGLLELLPDRYGAVTVAELVIDEYSVRRRIGRGISRR
jgi:hypothetical protein